MGQIIPQVLIKKIKLYIYFKGQDKCIVFQNYLNSELSLILSRYQHVSQW